MKRECTYRGFFTDKEYKEVERLATYYPVSLEVVCNLVTLYGRDLRLVEKHIRLITSGGM